jgi:hypothetical protein
MYSSQAHVLELHAIGHGVRPDFFQLAALNELNYFFYACNSVTHQNDIVAPLDILQQFVYLTN